MSLGNSAYHEKGRALEALYKPTVEDCFKNIHDNPVSGHQLILPRGMGGQVVKSATIVL